jgi:hypothetical protein
MGEVVRLFPRKKHLRGHARDCVTDAMRGVTKPLAVVIVALGENGEYNLRAVNDRAKIQDFDMYARAGAIIDKERNDLL